MERSRATYRARTSTSKSSCCSKVTTFSLSGCPVNEHVILLHCKPEPNAKSDPGLQAVQVLPAFLPCPPSLGAQTTPTCTHRVRTNKISLKTKNHILTNQVPILATEVVVVVKCCPTNNTHQANTRPTTTRTTFPSSPPWRPSTAATQWLWTRCNPPPCRPQAITIPCT